MTPIDYVKGLIVLLGYGVLAPALGFWLKDNRLRQRKVFALMVFMTSWQINKITIMLHSIEKYRGATKGFEFSLIIIVALGLLFAQAFGKQPPRKWLAPGALLWLLYVALSTISVMAAPLPLYVWMATVRFAQPVVVYLAAYHFFRDEEDMRVLIKVVGFTLFIQAFAVLKMKYVDHVYQVMGWFEHQNALAMWSYMCGLPMLASALAATKGAVTKWAWAGYMGCAVIIECALARASLLAFAAGSVCVIMLSLRDGVTPRRLVGPAILGLVGAIGLALTIKTIMFRFTEDRNQASSELRKMLIESSRLMLADSKIGLGWNNYAHLINPPYPYGDPIDQWQIDRGNRIDPDELKPQPESHYWLLLAENGYPGFYGYLLFITVTWWWCLVATWKYRGTIIGAFLFGLTMALLITYGHSTIERCLTQTKNIAMWLIFLGVAVKLRRTPVASTVVPAG